MLPSKRLVVLLTLAAGLFLAGAVVDALTVAGFAWLLGLSAYLAVDAVMLRPARELGVTRTAPARLSIAAPTPVVLELHNPTNRAMTVMLAERLPEGLESDPPVITCHLAPMERTTVQYRLLASRRGRYDLDRLDVRILPAMGLLSLQMSRSMPAAVQVFPNLVNLRRYELQLRRGATQDQGVARLRQLGAGSEFESLRLWNQDALSSVDWKATAKRSALIARNYQPERQQSVLVAIDTGRATAGEFGGISRLDYLVNATLMLAYVALRQGDWFSLVAFSDRIDSYLPPVRGVRSIERVARALYALEPRLVEADYAMACRFLGLRSRKRTLICLMTDIIDRQASDVIIGYMARFARYHLPLAVTLADTDIRALARQDLSAAPDPYVKAMAIDVLAARDEALAHMRSRGVDVLDVPPKAMTPELINRYLLIKSTRRL